MKLLIKNINKKMYNLEKNGKNYNKNFSRSDKMQANKMKNIVVLKELPSNLVEEAIIILKENQRIKEIKTTENKKFVQTGEEKESNKEYILKEAEMLVEDYIKKIEDANKVEDKKIKQKNINRLQKYSWGVTILFLISLIINFI